MHRQNEHGVPTLLAGIVCLRQFSERLGGLKCKMAISILDRTTTFKNYPIYIYLKMVYLAKAPPLLSPIIHHPCIKSAIKTKLEEQNASSAFI